MNIPTARKISPHILNYILKSSSRLPFLNLTADPRSITDLNITAKMGCIKHF